MTATSLTVTIVNTAYDIDDGSFSLPDKIEERTKCTFTVLDPSGVFSFSKGQKVAVTDTLEGLLFSGSILGSKRSTDVGSMVYHDIECTDKTETLDTKTSNKVYTGQYAGAIAVDQIKDQWVNGILANFAVDADDTQADFAVGTLNGTVATSNLGGDLELALAGNQLTITEASNAVFSSGTLTNTTTSNNTLIPSPTNAIKIQATESITNDPNAYTYVQIWNGSINVIAGRYLAYDIWISSSSPEAKIGIDIVFTDGTTLRDFSDATGNDQHNIPPHPKNDLSGYATDQWYHRKFLLDKFNGKTIGWMTIVCEGDKPGTYTGYVKNIFEVDVNDNIVNTFYNGTLVQNPPKQIQSNGYNTTRVTSVPTYDCTNSTRVSNPTNVTNVNLLRTSFVSWKATLPTGTSFTLEYSLDGGSSYIQCTNNSPLPSIPAGLSLSGKSLQFRETFLQGTGTNPEQAPTLNSVQLVLYPTYTATKSDVTISAATTAQWNAGTLTNTVASNNILALNGAVRDWHTANLTNMTIFGDNGTGPGPTTVRQLVNYDNYWVIMGVSMAGMGYFDFAPQLADGIIEGDIYIDVGTAKYGFFYRTTVRTNWDAQYAYALQITPTVINLQKASNSNTAAVGTATQIGTANVTLTGTAWHHVKVVFTGATHTVFLDDVQLFSVTDATYTAAGYCGLRVTNLSATVGYQGQLNNFGIVKALSGTWLSPSTSLAGAGTYGGSVISWQDVSTEAQSTNLLVESTINGGGSFQTVTNGGTVPNLTLGQSLAGVNLQLRVTLSTSSASSMPQIKYLVCRVLGGFSSSGTRISPALLLDKVITCGSTLVSWNAVQPASTTVTVATSLDGTSYTNVASGGSITGLAQQPAPTIDSFNLLTSSSYTNTARTGGTATTGWIWDTTNSRLSASGGTNALLLYTSISTKDADIYCDIDQADQAGIVWRRTDNSNFYSLEIFDGSSSAGATNIMRLFKVVANVKTQIGSDLPITLVRSQIVKRVRVTMVATAISVYFDSSLALSTTDASLTGPGLIGLIQVSGIARFYNLRIQPQGDNLVGKKVFTRVTLTSTDPTATPQVNDLTTLVTNPNIQAGTLIPTADFTNTYKSDNIDTAAKQSDYLWNVKADGSFIFMQRQTMPAPWVMTSKDILADGLEVDNSADLYFNRYIMEGVQSTVVTSETHTGDGSATSFTLKFPVVSMSSITLNGQTKTFGLKGTTGKDFYYAVGDSGLAQDSAGTVLQNVVDQLVISYTGQTTTTVTRDNTGQFPNTISQKQYRDLSGVSIPVQIVLNQASAVVSTNGNSDDLDVSLLSRIAIDVNFTAQGGTAPTVQFFLDRKAADGSYDPIWSSAVLTTLVPLSTTIGPRCAVTEVLGSTVRIRWVIGGTGGPSKSFSISIQGRVDASLAGIGIVECVEDVSSLNLNVAAANTLGDSKLQRFGVIGRTLKCSTKRTGLASGQYLSAFLPSLGLNDASLLITSVNRKQAFKMEGVQPSQSYTFEIEASEGPSLGSWQKAINNTPV